eukprot:scaffold74044_cov32-Tisochrysis_lutea.AAC.5
MMRSLTSGESRAWRKRPGSIPIGNASTRTEWRTVGPPGPLNGMSQLKHARSGANSRKYGSRADRRRVDRGGSRASSARCGTPRALARECAGTNQCADAAGGRAVMRATASGGSRGTKLGHWAYRRPSVAWHVRGDSRLKGGGCEQQTRRPASRRAQFQARVPHCACCVTAQVV